MSILSYFEVAAMQVGSALPASIRECVDALLFCRWHVCEMVACARRKVFMLEAKSAAGSAF